MPSVNPNVPAALGMRFTYQSIARPGVRLQAARALENLRGAPQRHLRRRGGKI
jgi:hypothetical protein